ncbi:uncharacterized protein CBO05P1_040 [Clostridium botulinum B str. Osaka05]|uniref:Uncharacterized protein n=1 Tax=Clostridium botulinum B str. Osaka05 TaxID=1407017 RepID=A0A060N9D0_CLOBO|nr:AAA family ATPase [Clostridium botulinum]BAO04759.1 uncharacterized protein CBO05P1_040 [Clostridium botulinum B str. Osaka05]
MGFKKAVREKVFVKVATIAPSGGGKSYSSLRVATGLAQEMAKDSNIKPFSKNEVRIAYIDTEGGRGKYYADEFDYDYMEIKHPYTPEKYIDAIEEAIDSGYQIIIVDSITHEWAGKGGCLEIVSNMPGSNTFVKWNKVTPRHNKFIDAILSSPAHIFATIRGKDKYVLEDNDGKAVPKKIGLGGVQRDDTEYEYTVTFNIDKDTHIAEATKDNTHLFENKFEKLTEKDGLELYKWANSGVKENENEETKKENFINPNTTEEAKLEDNPKNQIEETDLDSKTLKELITENAKTLSDEKQKEFRKSIKKVLGFVNYNKCDDIDKLTNLYNIVQDIQ